MVDHWLCIQVLVPCSTELYSTLALLEEHCVKILTITKLTNLLFFYIFIYRHTSTDINVLSIFSTRYIVSHYNRLHSTLESHKRIYNVIDNVRMHTDVMISTRGLPKPGGGRWCSSLSNFFNQRSQVQNKMAMMKIITTRNSRVW